MCIHKDTYINVPCSGLYNKNTGPCLKGKFNHSAIFFSVIEGAWGMSALFCFNLVFSIFFTMMVTKQWHSLLREVVESSSLGKVTSNFGNWLLVALLEQRGWTRWPPEAPSSSAILWFCFQYCISFSTLSHTEHKSFIKASLRLHLGLNIMTLLKKIRLQCISMTAAWAPGRITQCHPHSLASPEAACLPPRPYRLWGLPTCSCPCCLLLLLS